VGVGGVSEFYFKHLWETSKGQVFYQLQALLLNLRGAQEQAISRSAGPLEVSFSYFGCSGFSPGLPLLLW
jgi:hypothetical protein